MLDVRGPDGHISSVLSMEALDWSLDEEVREPSGWRAIGSDSDKGEQTGQEANT